MNYVCNEDMMVRFQNTTPGGLVYLGDVGIDSTKVVPTKSIKCKILNKMICTQKVQITWTSVMTCPYTFAGHTFVSGVGLVNATSTKVKAENQYVLRYGDTGTCAGSWTNNSSGATVVCACNVSISNAGQTKVMSN